MLFWDTLSNLYTKTANAYYSFANSVILKSAVFKSLEETDKIIQETYF